MISHADTHQWYRHADTYQWYRHADTHKLTLVRCRGIRRMHLRSNMLSRVQAPGRQFDSSAHGSLLHAKKCLTEREVLIV